MTADRVPDEWVEAAAFAMYWGLRETWEREPEEDRENYRIQARQVWPLVEAERDRAVRDALDEAAKRIAEADGTHYVDGEYAARIVADLRDGAR